MGSDVGTGNSRYKSPHERATYFQKRELQYFWNTVSKKDSAIEIRIQR